MRNKAAVKNHTPGVTHRIVISKSHIDLSVRFGVLLTDQQIVRDRTVVVKAICTEPDVFAAGSKT